MIDLTTLSHQLQFGDARVLCLGDVMLDKFVYGDAKRLSPEAPIPVLHVHGQKVMPGGAGNLIRNVGTLGASGTLISVVGKDEAGAELQSTIDRQLRMSARLIPCADRMTTVKTRYVVGGQQILRADDESKHSVDGKIAERVLQLFEAELAEADVVVLSDYGKGLLSDAVLGPAIEMARRAGKTILADPKSRDFARYRGVTVLMPNAQELTAATGLAVHTDSEAVIAGRQALAAGIDNILVTRSMQGMTLVPKEGEPCHLPARAREIHDVSGAGDTVAATMAVALASGIALDQACYLSNVAAGVVVGKVGTAAVHFEDLMSALHSEDLLSLGAEVVTAEQALDKVVKWRNRGLRIGFTNGCFDLIHPGHVSLLAQAKAACDRLIVGLNTDASIRRLKGPGRPVQNETARSVVLASLGAVDLVVPFDQDTPIDLIEALRPDVLVKGADYTRDRVVGADVVERHGGQVLLAKLEPGHSTTRTIAGMGSDRPAAQPDRTLERRH